MYLLDTNVVSELRKLDHPRTDPTFVDWVSKESGVERFHLSSVTVLEIAIGIEKLERRDLAQASVLRQWLEEYVLVQYATRLHAFDVSAASATAKFYARRTLSTYDSMIAGIAKHHSLIVATRNTKHFADLGVPFVNPWDRDTWN